MASVSALCGIAILLSACGSGSGGGSGARITDAGTGSAGSGAGGSGNGGGSANGGTSSTNGGTSSTGGAGGATGSGGASGGTKGDASLGTGGAGGGSTDAGGDAGPIWCGKPKPGPTNTGVPAGTKLVASGPVQATTKGQVIEGLDIAGEITVLADDVVIRNVRVTSGDYYPIRYFDNNNTGLLVEDSEIVGTSDSVTAGLSFANYTARRLNIHGGADGLKADSNVLVEDCWIHDLRNGAGQHNDGVQSTGGKGVTIRHNFISGASNACVQTGDENAATEDLTIECNWLYGGGWTLNIRGTGATVPKNTKILNNRFGRDAGYGPWALDDPSPTISGNVYDDDGAPIP